MDFIFGLIGELWFIILVVAAMAAWEHYAYLNSQRVWMWVAGLIGIALLIWFKGAEYMWSWMLGAGWLAVLAYADYRLLVGARDDAAPTPTDSRPANEPKSFGRRRY
jgi:phosphotransferase system  glucose/maltose/N-acetylglucosamine-specific IIC component